MASWLALHRAFERCIAAVARRSSSCWSTTRDCAVITAACGRKHVGTRGRGGSSVPLYVSTRVRARAYVSALRGVCNVPWESIPLRERERGRGGERGERAAQKQSLPTAVRAVFPINPVFRVFPPTLPWGRRFGMPRRNRRPSIVNSSSIVLSHEN